MADLTLTPDLLVAVVALAVATVAVGVAWTARRRLARLDRFADAGDGGAEITATLARHDDLLRELRSDLLVVHDNTHLLRRMAKESLSHVGLVRYDAFSDRTGAMSYSLALLDERGDGVVLSSLVGRNDVRTYAKRVTGGRVGSTMSGEERTAIERALTPRRDDDEVEGTDLVAAAEAS